SLFPDIEPACITAVITHDLKALDFYKLDIQLKDSEPSYSLSTAGTFKINVSKHKSYKNLSSIIFPLHTYFAILMVHIPGCNAASYLTHIVTIAVEYEWMAVLEYHTLFFNRWRGNMLTGFYDGWSTPDITLLSMHIFPHKKMLNITPSSKLVAKCSQTSSTDPC
ncbi:hypothetical protein B0H10DRAFT_1809051, partial [Mycena sp. CBHHK59/15]